MVLFRPSPKSIVKAFLASRVYRAKPMEHTGTRRFFFEDHIEADALDYDALYSQYKEAFGGLDFLEDEKLWSIMEDEIFWASRFNMPDRFQLIFSVLAQIEKCGTKSYLSQSSPEAKEMKDRVRRVTGEFRRAKQYLTFQEDRANRVMIGKASFEHKVVDLMLRHFAKRYPGYSIVILDDEHAHICYKDAILVDKRERFPGKPGRREATRYWMLFSDAKHIEAKRDKEYDLDALPTNYWKWISDGTEANEPPPKVTLDDFVA